jgi:hypothetical protein
MKVTVIFKNKETQKEETSELFLKIEDINCLYSDQYGVVVVVKCGKSYRVKDKLSELEGML